MINFLHWELVCDCRQTGERKKKFAHKNTFNSMGSNNDHKENSINQIKPQNNSQWGFSVFLVGALRAGIGLPFEHPLDVCYRLNLFFHF